MMNVRPPKHPFGSGGGVVPFFLHAIASSAHFLAALSLPATGYTGYSSERHSREPERSMKKSAGCRPRCRTNHEQPRL